MTSRPPKAPRTNEYLKNGNFCRNVLLRLIAPKPHLRVQTSPLDRPFLSCFDPWSRSRWSGRRSRPAFQIRLLGLQPGNVVNLDNGVTGSPQMLSWVSALITVQIGVRAGNTVAHQSAFRNGNRASKNSIAPLRSSVSTSRPNSVSHFSISPERGVFPNTPARRVSAMMASLRGPRPRTHDVPRRVPP